MSKCVILREDDRDLTMLVCELLEEQGYTVVCVTRLEDLLIEAARRSPCIALVDGSSPTEFDLWWLGNVLAKMGVPPVAFTAHASARTQFEADAGGYIGVVSKPFEADEFIALVNTICWDKEALVAS
jgi:DNA-binding NtrC family response regulator